MIRTGAEGPFSAIPGPGLPYRVQIAMSLIHKVFVGDNVRKSRFHDEKGNLVELAGWIYLPHAYLTAGLK